MKRFAFILLLACVMVKGLNAQPQQSLAIPPFTNESASKFAKIAFTCIINDYPVKVAYTINSPDDLVLPSKLTPAFSSCYDWHTSIQSHWMLVKILGMFPDIEGNKAIVGAISKNLTPENIAAEVNNLMNEGNTCFGRPYGWAWLMKLGAELAESDIEYCKQWHQNLLPLIAKVKERYYTYLPSLYYPVRRGVYDNTAFAISMALDYARAVDDKTFEKFLTERARFYYINDKNVPASWEPDGDDFFSPSLIEADLMRRVIDRGDFVKWFKSYMPEIPFGVQHPAVVSNRTDPKGLHLNGLNLSRAWCMFELAKALPVDSQTHRDLWQAGYRHAAEALPNAITDQVIGAQWLAVFAVYMYASLADIEP